MYVPDTRTYLRVRIEHHGGGKVTQFILGHGRPGPDRQPTVHSLQYERAPTYSMQATQSPEQPNSNPE